jgi:hypothetical protein
MSVAPLFALAADEPLRLKPGLWEWTIDLNWSGGAPMSPEALARTSPEQRAEIEAHRAGKGTPTHVVFKRCMTQEALDRLGKPNSLARCKRMVVSTTTKLESQFECRSLTFRFEATGPEAIAIHRTETSHFGAAAVSTEDEQAKWLSDNCGNIKR